MWRRGSFAGKGQWGTEGSVGFGITYLAPPLVSKSSFLWASVSPFVKWRWSLLPHRFTRTSQWEQVCTVLSTATHRGCYCPGKGGVLTSTGADSPPLGAAQLPCAKRKRKGSTLLQSPPNTHTQNLLWWIQQKMTSKFLVAPTKHGFVTCQEATHRLDFQSVSVAAKESGLGLEEGSGHTIAGCRGDLLQSVLQWRDLVTEKRHRLRAGWEEDGYTQHVQSFRKPWGGGWIWHFSCWESTHTFRIRAGFWNLNKCCSY